jgi:predicted neuraminidase
MSSKSGPWAWLVCTLMASYLAQSQRPSSASSVHANIQSLPRFRVARQSGLEEVILQRRFPSSHAANLLKLHNGDLLCFWFSGKAEGESNVAIVMSRLPNGSQQWSKTAMIDHRAGRSFQNPVAFQLPDGYRIWLLHTSQPAGEGQANAEVLYLTSDDAGETWTSPRSLFKQPGSFVRHPPVLISKNNWLLPIYYTPGQDITHGAELNYSAIEITHDGGTSWKECRVPGSNGLVQQSTVRLPTGKFVGFFRSRYADFIYQSTSVNGCEWTVPARTHLPNNNSSIQVALLQDGSLVVAFNNSSSGLIRDKPRTSARIPLTIALSQDGGNTWPWIRDIEAGSPADRHSTDDRQMGPEEYSYPSVLQDAKGKINVAYTYRRESIKVVRFDEEWIKHGSTEGTFKGDRPN